MIKSLYTNFQRWTETGSLYIISDTHFDDNDCKIMDKNWITPLEHIEQINKEVMANDTLICLGDVGNPEYFKLLRSRYKVLITGNHDKGASQYKDYFDEIYDGPLMISSKIMLSHEPILSPHWVNIHGHKHDLPGGIRYIEGFKTVNLASNTVDFSVFNLGKEIRLGLLSDIDSIHRNTIDRASIYNSYKGDD